MNENTAYTAYTAARDHVECARVPCVYIRCMHYEKYRGFRENFARGNVQAFYEPYAKGTG